MVVPTTRTSIGIVKAQRTEEHLVVASPDTLPGSIDPAAYFLACREMLADRAATRSAYIFTDQFVDAPFAPLLVRDRAGQMFMSATEVLARAVHGVNVVVWTAGGLVQVPSCQFWDPIPVLRALRTYYEDCEHLGDKWLMRARKDARRPRNRVEAAIKRTRVCESAVLRAFDDRQLDPSAHQILRGLLVHRTRLVGQRAALA